MSKKTLEELEADRFAWSLKNFPNATVSSSFLKAQEEMHEVLKSLRDGEPKQMTAKEFADHIMCVFDMAGRAGIYVGDIRDAFEEKLIINKNDEWLENPDKTYSRVKKEAVNG